MNRTEMIELLKSLTPCELRVLAYVHKCTDSTSLVTCCEQQRCHACHIQHLTHEHTKAELLAYEKFSTSTQLTWDGYIAPKVNKKAKTSTRRKTDNHERVNLRDLNNAQLDELEALLRARRAK